MTVRSCCETKICQTSPARFLDGFTTLWSDLSRRTSLMVKTKYICSGIHVDFSAIVTKIIGYDSFHCLRLSKLKSDFMLYPYIFIILTPGENLFKSTFKNCGKQFALKRSSSKVTWFLSGRNKRETFQLSNEIQGHVFESPLQKITIVDPLLGKEKFNTDKLVVY